MTRPPIVLVVIAMTIAVSCAGDSGNHGPETTAAVEIQSGFAQVHDGRLYYELTGSGDAIVLVHGNVGDRRHWDAQFSALSR